MMEIRTGLMVNPNNEQKKIAQELRQKINEKMIFRKSNTVGIGNIDQFIDEMVDDSYNILTEAMSQYPAIDMEYVLEEFFGEIPATFAVQVERRVLCRIIENAESMVSKVQAVEGISAKSKDGFKDLGVNI